LAFVLVLENRQILYTTGIISKTPTYCVGCTYLWCGCLTIPLVQIMLQFHALFCNQSEPELTGFQKVNEMLFNEKYLENADLIIPFQRCSFGKPVTDCPFIKYWNIENTDVQILPILTLPVEELEYLRDFHRKCMLKQVERVQEEFTFE